MSSFSSSHSSPNSTSLTTPPTQTEGVAAKQLVQQGISPSMDVNDKMLRELFDDCLQTSAALPPAERLIMYDACDDQEIVVPLGPCMRKRLDPRRNTKPKKPDVQLLVCTPFDPAAFNFTKIRNPGEILLELRLPGNEVAYRLLTNKFPLFKRHMLLVCTALVPQQMSGSHLSAITELLRSTSFCAYFNSWCASASVNHFHCHVIDEFPPVTELPLVPGQFIAGTRCMEPAGFPGTCFVVQATDVPLVAKMVLAMQAENQPHNLLFTPTLIYVFPKPLVRPERSFELYPETVGGPELLGSFTMYTQHDYDKLTATDAAELLKINTAPLPSRLMQVLDDRVIGSGRPSAFYSRIRASQSLDSTLPSMASMAA